MDEQKRKMNISIGLLAHVDAGKTTLSEAILYHTGAIRNLGRVDHKTAFLDTDEIEKNRGITVYSKEAVFSLGKNKVHLLDTPGHTDFTTEMERTLQVLDYAILIISGADGVQGHTLTLWKLLASYKVPCFIFVNKMDQPTANKEELMKDIAENLGTALMETPRASKGMSKAEWTFAELSDMENPNVMEEIASANEKLMEEYLSDGTLREESIADAIKNRQLIPVSFGSALKMEGIKEFLDLLAQYMTPKTYGEEFGARVYKISRDKKGNRLTHLKVTGGTLRNKMILESGEKIEQIREYNGENFQSIQSVESGSVCAVLGLNQSYAGQGLGAENSQIEPLINPSLTYQVLLDESMDPVVALQKLRQLEEEEPSLHIIWIEEKKEIHVQVMGPLELEILSHQAKKRFDMDISFGNGSIIYKESILDTVIGVGHYEPLRHYAEVHLKLEPMPRGTGLVFASEISEDKFPRNWQRLVMTHLEERNHRGMLTGSQITDIRISIVNGKAHLKHTDGGDFRQATYRAVGQALMKAKSVLLEPAVEYRLSLPTESVGRGLTDMQRLGASASLTEAKSDGMALITGKGPLSTLKDYSQDVIAYTKGKGSFSQVPAGYMNCHNEAEVVSQLSYDPEADFDNPTGSVFCQGGSALFVPWDQVDSMAHLEIGKGESKVDDKVDRYVSLNSDTSARKSPITAGNDELDEIFLRTYGKSKRDQQLLRQKMSKRPAKPEHDSDFPMPKWNTAKGSVQNSAKGSVQNSAKADSLLIIDGYNVIFAWDELKELAKVNIDSAREAFIDTLGNYIGYKKIDVLVVFDGYKLSGNPGTKLNYDKLEKNGASLQVVFTKEAETADRYIEKTVFALGKKKEITVVTSDRLVQMAALGDGAFRLSAREFYQELTSVSEEIRQKLSRQAKDKNQPFAKAFEEE